MNKPSSYRVQGLLPRTNTIIDLFKGDTLEEAEKFASKNVKYFPKLIITGGCDQRFGKEGKKYLEVVENPDYIDRSRDKPKNIKIGKIKRKTPFVHHIVYEDSEKVSFLVRYKKAQVRVCTVDANMRDVIQDYLAEYKHDWKVKIHRGSLPLVYMRVRGNKHITLLELVTGSPMSGYIVFKDNNPYNYQRTNIIRTLRAVSRNKPLGVAKYYGVKPTPSGKYRGLISKKGIKYTTKVNKDPVIVAKEIDQICMELFGRMAARNFPYEYYLAFEPQYIRNVK